MNNSGKITYFAETDFRNARRRFGIKENDRMRHMYVIGKKAWENLRSWNRWRYRTWKMETGLFF